MTNALRLNWFNLHDTKHDKKQKRSIGSSGMGSGGAKEGEEGEKKAKAPGEKSEIRKKEDKRMTKTMKIEGMMCGHCEARVKKCLEALEGVSEAKVSHEEGTAVVTLSGDVSDDVLKKAVEDQDYQVLSVQ